MESGMPNFQKKMIFLILTFIFVFHMQLFSEKQFNITTDLMKSTFKIEGGGFKGTVFIMGYKHPSDTLREPYTYAVLLTAAHVLDKIKSDTAKLISRSLHSDGYRRLPFQIYIRKEGIPLWVQHPEADVAAMWIALPYEVGRQIMPYSTDFLATDAELQKYEIGPGEDLLVLGFPYGFESNEFGFPILRSGRISSYPLLPTSKTKTFQLDFEVFPGNSGGPVFLHSMNRLIDGNMIVRNIDLVLGIVSEEMIATEPINTKTLQLSIKGEITHKLGIAYVVHASFVKEVLKMLPPYPVDELIKPIKIYKE